MRNIVSSFIEHAPGKQLRVRSPAFRRNPKPLPPDGGTTNLRH